MNSRRSQGVAKVLRLPGSTPTSISAAAALGPAPLVPLETKVPTPVLAPIVCPAHHARWVEFMGMATAFARSATARRD